MKIKTSFYSLDWKGKRYSDLQVETLDWKDEAEARMTYDLCQTEIISMKVLPDPAPASVGVECKNCKNGYCTETQEIGDGLFSHSYFGVCVCCNGDYTNCLNCKSDKSLDNADMEAMHDYIDKYLEEGSCYSEDTLIIELTPSYKRFQEANKPNEDAVDVGI